MDSSRDFQILKKILSEITFLRSISADYTEDMFLKDEKAMRSVSMTLINIGELVKSLTEEFKNSHNHIHWRAIAGMRDIAAHKYQTLRMEDVWFTINNDIPELKKELQKIIS